MAKKPAARKPAAKPAKPSLDTRIRTDAALRKRVLSNPGLRSKLSASSLQKYAPAQAKARALSVRLNAPITPGSSTTERDLAHEAQAATTVKYGSALSDAATNVGIGQQTQRDTGALYDQYRQALQQHTANIQAFQAGAQQALQNTQAGITGLGQQQATDMQAQANAGAAQQGVAQAGNLAPLADQALGVRQQLAGTFGAQQAMTGAAENTYADTQANVVAPGQKLTALNQQAGKVKDLRTKQQALKAEADAYNQTFRDTRRQDEFKNVLAQQTLTGNQAIAGAKVAASAAANDPATVAAKTSATASAQQAAKYGYTAHQWALLGPSARQRIINAAKAQGKSKPDLGKVNKYGYTEEQWRAKSTAERQKIIKDFSAKGGPGAKPGKGPDWHTPNELGTALTQLTGLKQAANAAKTGASFVPGHPKQTPLGRREAAQKILGFGPIAAKLKDPILVTAALDAVYDGRLSRATVRKLIAAGYKPSRVMATLGVGSGPTPRGNTSTTRPGTGGASARQ